MISIKNLFLAYNKDYYSLYDINLELEKGGRLALIGEEGSGRTSLLRVLAGLEPSAKGEVYIKKMPVNKVDFASDVNLAFISHKPVFLERKSVYENLKYILSQRNKNKTEWDKIIIDVLEKYRFIQYKDTRVDILSDAQRKILQFVRADLRPLEILLVDDGFDNMPEEEQEQVIEKLRLLIKPKELTVIIASENIKYIKKLAGTVKFIRSGNLTDEEK